MQPYINKVTDNPETLLQGKTEENGERDKKKVALIFRFLFFPFIEFLPFPFNSSSRLIVSAHKKKGKTDVTKRHHCEWDFFSNLRRYRNSFSSFLSVFLLFLRTT
jgi:hypothetical protein